MSAPDKPHAPVLVPRPEKRTKDHQVEEWSSGQRGGGSVPDDFAWRTNPKQWQEELGTATTKRKLDD